MEEKTSKEDENLVNKRVFNFRRSVATIPTEVFVLGLFSVFFVAFLIVIYIGIKIAIFFVPIYAVLVFMPLYLAHKEDPVAYMVWTKSLFSPSTLTMCNVKVKKFKVISKGGGEEKIDLKDMYVLKNRKN